jgi:hypothetical protein
LVITRHARASAVVNPKIVLILEVTPVIPKPGYLPEAEGDIWT